MIKTYYVSFFATCRTDCSCHTERSEVSTMESRFFAIAQNGKENSIKQQTQ
ncbi:MAG: hypothetical protein SPJ83_06800 [Helicobacter sp.]|uniref:hypothetical protein n=1 Tax=Helicobacter sp. TaxID=218 RepID=UPI002A9147D6|nr:hypothetical protein [Helicobacter sp.]MDY5822474.1 hypothetical protein [Helicobacter sp.]